MPTDKKGRSVQVNNPPGGLPAVYANHVAFGATAFDVRLIFGQITDASAEQVTIDQAVLVTLSWAQAKILDGVLQANIKAYEEFNGEIKLPKIQPNALQMPDGFIKRVGEDE